MLICCPVASIIDFAQKLSDRQLQDAGIGKQCVLKAASNHLPAQILRRKKQPFTFPIGTMIASEKVVQDYVFDTVFSESNMLRDYFDFTQLQKLKGKAIDATSASIFWALLTLKEWHTANVSTWRETAYD